MFRLWNSLVRAHSEICGVCHDVFWQWGKPIASYLGLVPLEDSSGNRRRLGHITKQGSAMLRFLLVEAAQVTARSIPEWRSNTT
jgi:transposase